MATRAQVARKMRRMAQAVAVHGSTITDAMTAAGYSYTSAHSHTPIVSQHPVFKAELSRLSAIFQEQDDRILHRVAATMRKGMKAKKPVVEKQVESRSEDGTRTTETLYKEVPDHAERRKAAEDIARVFGELRDNKTEGGGNTFNLNVLLQQVQKAEEERGL